MRRTTIEQWEDYLRKEEIAVCSNCRVRLDYESWQTYKYLGLVQYYNEIIAILNQEGGSDTTLTFAFPYQLEAVPKVDTFLGKIVRVTWNPHVSNIHHIQAGWFEVHRDGEYMLKATTVDGDVVFIPYLDFTGVIQFTMERL